MMKGGKTKALSLVEPDVLVIHFCGDIQKVNLI